MTTHSKWRDGQSYGFNYHAGAYGPLDSPAFKEDAGDDAEDVIDSDTGETLGGELRREKLRAKHINWVRELCKRRDSTERLTNGELGNAWQRGASDWTATKWRSEIERVKALLATEANLQDVLYKRIKACQDRHFALTGRCPSSVSGLGTKQLQAFLSDDLKKLLPEKVYLEGDLCPNCAVESGGVQLLVERRRKHDGKAFIGCERFPTCTCAYSAERGLTLNGESLCEALTIEQMNQQISVEKKEEKMATKQYEKEDEVEPRGHRQGLPKSITEATEMVKDDLEDGSWRTAAGECVETVKVPFMAGVERFTGTMKPVGKYIKVAMATDLGDGALAYACGLGVMAWPTFQNPKGRRLSKELRVWGAEKLTTKVARFVLAPIRKDLEAFLNSLPGTIDPGIG